MAPVSEYLVTSVLQPQLLIYSKLLRPVTHEEYKSAMLEIYTLIQKNSLENWVMVSSISDFTMQDQKWSVEQLGLLLQGTPLRKVAMVRDSDAILELIAESMRAKVYRIFGKEKILEHFATLQEALQFLSPNVDPGKLIQNIELLKSKQD